jgi:UDP-N-acetylglucosamine acyltransferase
MNIHETAVVSPKAELGKDVVVGPYSVINEDVQIGDGTVISAHVFIDKWTTIGKNNKIFSGAVIGTESQDLKFTGEKSFVKIGDNNIIREYVTINRATEPGGFTKLGNNNAILSYCHIAHDCILGNKITISNVTTLAGHVEVEDQAGLGGYVGIHQFVKIGSMSFIGGWSKVVKDVPPFLRVSGTPLRVYGLNSVGLDRNNVPLDSKKALKKAYQILFRSGHNVTQAIELIRADIEQTEHVKMFIAFLESSERGICKS